MTGPALVSFEAISLTEFDQLQAQHDAANWMRVKIADLSLRGKCRFTDDDTLYFNTTYTGHNHANHTLAYEPGITLGLSPNNHGLYDLTGIGVEVLWLPAVRWFLVLITSPAHGPLVYRGTPAPGVKRPNGMSVYVKRITEVV